MPSNFRISLKDLVLVQVSDLQTVKKAKTGFQLLSFEKKKCKVVSHPISFNSTCLKKLQVKNKTHGIVLNL